jgi:hypothetical protein
MVKKKGKQHMNDTTIDKCANCNHAEEKSKWGDGPWQNEPDRVEFHHAGLACILHRNRVGTWCGYVGVPPTHPAHGKRYDDVDVSVHGGLTYADHCMENGPICHVPAPGEPDDLYWFGWDAAHYTDLSPGIVATLRELGSTRDRSDEIYRDVTYARNQTESLAEQLALME